MREINVENLKTGDTLASSIKCNFSYRLLLPKGTVLNEGHLRRLNSLKAQGYCLVLEPSDMEGIRLDLLDRVDEKAKKAYLDTYVVGKSIFENLQRGNPINIKLVCEAVDVLVEEIMQRGELLLQLAANQLIDDYTFSHMVNVAVYTASYGRCQNYSTGDISDLCLAGLLHDVGKARLPAEVLGKQGELTAEELTLVRSHSEYGYLELLKEKEINERVRQGVLQHHERGDGSGYPKGLRQKEISRFARIIAIADVYDTLTSDRCYRSRVLPHESAEVLMGDCALNRLDLEMVRVFLSSIVFYPLGTKVVLSDGRHARVILINDGFPLRPVLEVLESKDSGARTPAGILHLLEHPTLFIIKVVS
ncbi:MAG: HD-GYP domain-containing protein [Firmicutes bacterium]|nr:HD-GYP domain-containing protein [Bacillota bacterium]